MSAQADPTYPLAGECVAPVLPMRDADATAAFYARIGFDEVRRHGEPARYLIVRRGWMELHFFSHPGCDPATSIAGAYMRVSDVDRFTAGFGTVAGSVGHGAPRYLPPEDKPWGMRQAALVDPDGNLIQFGTPLPAH
jgi:catechol 2,3-dioxygenase-like lactoylglutathione lyase family enzyme